MIDQTESDEMTETPGLSIREVFDAQDAGIYDALAGLDAGVAEGLEASGVLSPE